MKALESQSCRNYLNQLFLSYIVCLKRRVLLASTNHMEMRNSHSLSVTFLNIWLIIKFDAMIHHLFFAAFVNGQRRGDTPEKPFRMGDSIAKEMSEDCIPDLHVASELALCAKTLQEVVAEVSRTSVSASEQQLIVDKKMKELGMTR